MFEAIKVFMAPPIFPDDEDKSRTAKAFDALMLVTAGIAIALVVGVILFVSEKLPTLITIAILLVLLTYARYLAHRGHVRLATGAFVGGSWIVFTVNMLLAGGMSSTTLINFPVVLVLASTLQGKRATTFYAILTIAMGFVITVLQGLGYVPPIPTPGAVASWLILSAAIVVAYVPLTLTMNNLYDALTNARQQLGERMKIEQGLRNTEVHLRLALTAAKMWTWEWDLKTNTMLRLIDPINVIKIAVDTDPESYFRLLHPEDRERVRTALDRSIRGEPYSQEYRVLQPDGSYRWIASQGQVYVDKSERPERVLGVAQDITERRQTDEALAKERNLLRTVIDFLPDNLYVKDRNSRFLLNNVASMRLMGVSRQEELLGKTDFDFFPEEKVKPWYAQEQSIMESGEPSIDQEEFRPWIKDKRRWIVTNLIPLRDESGGVIGLVGRDSDITALKRVEDREHAIADSLRGVVEAIDELIAIEDVDTFYRRAVELARDKLKAERCGILLLDTTRQYLMGTYGTDGQGRTTNEHKMRFLIPEENRKLLLENPDSWIFQQTDQVYWDGEKPQKVGNGWIATTMIRVGLEPIGIFSNDTAVTKTPIDTIQQEAIVLYCSLLGNILGRKGVEDALRKSEKRYRIISELISDYAYATEVLPDGNYALGWITEESFKRVTGYGWEDNVGNFKLFHPDDVERAMRDMKPVLAGHFQHAEYRIITKSGEVRWVHVQRQPEWSDEEKRVIRIYGAVEDITERKLADEALAKERKLLRTVIDFLPDNIAVKDRSSQFILNNKVSLQILGVSRQEELLGKTDFDFFPPDLAQLWFAQEQKTMQTDQPIIAQEAFMPFSGPERRWTLLSEIPIKDDQGEVTGLVCISSDITHLKQVEDRERAIAESLRGVVGSVDELIATEHLDLFYRRAVELAREKLKVERSAILLFDPTRQHLIGTYGTDGQGRTTDERTLITPLYEEHLKLFEQSRDPWIVQQSELTYWDGNGIQPVGSGWVADTIIRIGEEPIGIFSNDTAITRAPLDTIKQEAIVVYCSLLGNILRQKRIEVALRQGEKRYRVISELISDYAYAYDVHSDGSYTLDWITEDSFKRVTGFDWNETVTNFKVYHPDDVEASKQDLALVLEGQTRHAEYRIITKSGEIRWLHIQRQPEWSDDEQRVIRFYGAANDITERKLADEALANERKLLRTVIDFLPDNIYVKDRNSRFILNNAVSIQLLGVSRQEDLLGKTDLDFFPTDVATSWIAQEKALMDSGEPIINKEEFQPWRGRDRRWVVSSLIPLRDDQGDVIGLVGMSSDITQIKQVEDRERAIAQSLRGVVEAIDELIATENLDTFYRRAVELAREKLRVERCGIHLVDSTREHLIWTYGTDNEGRTVDEHGLITPIRGNDQELLSGSRDSWLIEDMRHGYAVGDQLESFGSGWVAGTMIRIGEEPIGIFSNDNAISKTPLDPIQQEAIRLYCSLLGKILQNKRVEDEVRRLNAELERRVSERTRDLEVAAEVGKQATKALELDFVLSEIVKQTRSGFDLYEAGIFLYDEEANSLRLVAAAGEYTMQATETVRDIVYLDESNGHLAQAVKTKSTLLVNDVSKSENFRPHPRLPHTQAEMIVPMMIGDRLMGALDIQHKQINTFTNDHLRVFASLADQIAIAIRNAQLFVEMQAARQERETLFRIGEAMNAATTYVEIVDAIVKAMGGPPLMVSLGIYENYDRQRASYIDVVARYYPDQKKTVAVDARTPLASLSDSVPKLYVIEDTDEPDESLVAEAANHKMKGFKSVLSAGVSLGQHQIGALALVSYKPYQFSPVERRLMAGAADLAAAAVERGRLLEEAETARKMAEEANRIKSQFLANMSHELRTPLNAILNFTAFVADGVMGPVNNEQIEILQQSLSSGKHLLSLINDILDVTKIEAGLMDLFIQKVNLNEILGATVSVVKGLIKDKPIEFTADIEDGLPPTFGDIRRLRQVFLNLVSNAVKFTPHGKIKLRAYSDQEAIHISVSDTGIGIAPEDHDLIFQSFKQAKTDLLEIVGTGLGLPISKFFVESHGGKIWLESAKGVGTTFYVDLPFLTEEQARTKNAEIKK